MIARSKRRWGAFAPRMVLLLTAIVALLVTLGHLMVDEEHVEESYHSGVKEKQIETNEDSFVRGKDSLRKNATETTASDKGKNKNKNKKKKNRNKNKRADNATETVSIETETISKNTNTTTEKGVTTKPESTPIAPPADNAANEDKLGEELEELYERLTPQQRKQVENYRKGTALMLNIHPTHHAGTTFCGTIGKSAEPLPPSFACMGDRNEVAPDPLYCESESESENKKCLSYQDIAVKAPWKREETGPFIEAIRPYFHMISWEFGKPKKSMDDPEWDNPNLVSVVVTRDPMSRLLAGDGITGVKYVGYNKGELSRKGWWDYAAYNYERGTDNFFLRILTTTSIQKDEPIPNHIEARVNRTTEEMMDLFPTGINETHFEHGKALLDKFTFVLDVACLDEGMDALADLLGIAILPERRKNGKKHTYATPRERIGYEDVYEYLVAKNEWDIALYEYSKTISLVKC